MNARKKILFIHHGKGLGGAPLSLLYLIQSLDQTRYQPVVLFLYHSDVINLYKANGIDVVGPTNTLDFPHTKIWWFRWYHLPYLARAINSTIKTLRGTARHWLDQIKPDLVHLNTSSLIAWGVVARRMGIPVVWHIREPLADGYLGLRRSLVRSVVGRHATAIIPICHNDARPWRTNPKTTVVYNAVDPGRFNATVNGNEFCRQHNLNPHNPIILFVGGLSLEKGTLPILNITRQVIKLLPSTQLVIAGHGDFSGSATGIRRLFPAARYQRQVQRALAALGPSAHVLGPIQEIPAAMAASTVVVFPATVGHFARPVIEAGFMHKPVVASDVAPLNELVEHQKTGFLLSPDDEAAWVETLVHLLTNPSLATTIGDNASFFCQQRFNLAAHGEQIQAVYATIFAQEQSCNQPLI